MAKNAMTTEVTEVSLNTNIQTVLARADQIAIQDDASYKAAAETVKAVKGLAKSVKGFWEPLRVAAKKHYDQILASRKAMMEPLDKAEAHLKEAMTAYTLEQERAQRAAEEALRKAAAAEAEAKLREAMAAQARGDFQAAMAALADANVMQGASQVASVESRKPQAQGIAQTKTWKITSVDPSKVPVNMNGAELRPVDTAAVMRLIKATKGTVQIPGITFEEDVTISVRA